MFAQRFGTALKNLALALLNATLILVALCLFLAWRLSAEVHDVTEIVTDELTTIRPLRAEVAGMTDQIAGLRSDLAAMGDQTATLSSETLGRVRDRAEELQAQLDTLSQAVERITENPEILLDRAVTLAVERLGDEASELMACRAGG